MQYNRVSALGDPRDAALGIGRALIGLSEPADAVRLLRPYTRSSSVRGPPLEVLISAALIMAASTLLPVGPLDGAHLGKAGIVTGAGVVGGALLFGLGLI